jgi:hypothetical protein
MDQFLDNWSTLIISMIQTIRLSLAIASAELNQQSFSNQWIDWFEFEFGE